MKISQYATLAILQKLQKIFVYNVKVDAIKLRHFLQLYIFGLKHLMFPKKLKKIWL